MPQLTQRDHDLMMLASKLIRKRVSAVSTVACALRTGDGDVFTGVNVEALHSSPCSMCAEYSAIGTMHSKGDASIATTVAIDDEGIVLPPCGRCREMIRQFGNPFVILQKKGKIFKMRLDDLIPMWEST